MILTTDAVAVWRSGRTQQGRAKASKVQEADAAIAALERGVDPVFVVQRDAERVRAWAMGQGGAGCGAVRPGAAGRGG